MKKIFVAVIGAGQYDGYYEDYIFCSTDKKLVEGWVDKFNRIIAENYWWATRESSSLINVLWEEYFKDNAKAFVKEIPMR